MGKSKMHSLLTTSCHYEGMAACNHQTLATLTDIIHNSCQSNQICYSTPSDRGHSVLYEKKRNEKCRSHKM